MIRFPFAFLIFVSFLCFSGFVFSLAKAEDATNEGFVPSTSEPLEFLPSLRILGGLSANDDGQFSYQVSLRSRNSHICGGTIISRNYVVTAGHCVSITRSGRLRITPASLLTIRAGSAIVNSGGEVVQVAEVKVHPNYKNFNNDIALLRLARPLNFTNRIAAIALGKDELTPGTAVTVSGWGRLRNSGETPTRLQYVTLNAISNADCRRRIGNVPDQLLCLAHSTGTGACQGDSGGPAVYNRQLVGVTNFIVGGCGMNAPDGFAKVSFHNSWIKQNSDVV